MSDFMGAVDAIRARKRPFLMVGQRWNIDFARSLDVSHTSWQSELRRYVDQAGSPTPPEWIDYFVFPRGLYCDIPSFAIGRAAFDNWLLWKARSLKASVIDASECVMVVHQNHDYAHHPQGQKGVLEGAEAQRNRELMGGWIRCFTLDDATHRLTQTGLKLNWTKERVMGKVRRRWHWLINWARPLFHRFGLRRSRFFRILDHVGKMFHKRSWK